MDGRVFPIRCGQWKCPVCAPINALEHAIRTLNGVQALRAAGVQCQFVTLTQPGNVRTREFAYAILSEQWDNLRNRWSYALKRSGLPFIYAAFVEGQQRRGGMPHFHIVAAFAPKLPVLRKIAVESGLGYQIDRQDIKPSAGVAWYVSKYSTKSTDSAAMPKGFRRCRYSENWPKMLLRSEVEHEQAIVKQRNESVSMWALRAAMHFPLKPEELVWQVEALSESDVRGLDGLVKTDYDEYILRRAEME